MKAAPIAAPELMGSPRGWGNENTEAKAAPHGSIFNDSNCTNLQHSGGLLAGAEHYLSFSTSNTGSSGESVSGNSTFFPSIKFRA